MKKMSRLMAFAIVGMVASSTIQAQAPAEKSYTKRGREFLWRHKGKIAAAGALGAAAYYGPSLVKRLDLLNKYQSQYMEYSLAGLLENPTASEFKQKFMFIKKYFLHEGGMDDLAPAVKVVVAKKLWADNLAYMIASSQGSLLTEMEEVRLKEIAPGLN